MDGLKEVEYPGFRPLRRKGRVAYIIVDAKVFFSGLTHFTEATSTINDAEGVVKAICQAEGLDWQKCQFYDIQTHQGYKKSPGEYCVDRLKVVSRQERGSEVLRVKAWHPIKPEEISPDVLELFKPLIDS